MAIQYLPFSMQCVVFTPTHWGWDVALSNYLFNSLCTITANFSSCRGFPSSCKIPQPLPFPILLSLLRYTLITRFFSLLIPLTIPSTRIWPEGYNKYDGISTTFMKFPTRVCLQSSFTFVSLLLFAILLFWSCFIAFCSKGPRVLPRQISLLPVEAIPLTSQSTSTS